MNLEKLLRKHLEANASHYEESKKRGIVVDDLDVDAFVEGVTLEMNYVPCGVCGITKMPYENMICQVCIERAMIKTT